MELEEFRIKMNKCRKGIRPLHITGCCMVFDQEFGESYYHQNLIKSDFSSLFRCIQPYEYRRFNYWLGQRWGSKEKREHYLKVFEEVAIIAELYKDY